MLGAALRQCGGIAFLSELIHDPLVHIQAHALLALGNLCSDAVDSQSRETKRLLLGCRLEVPLMRLAQAADEPAVQMTACATLQNLCHSSDWAARIVECGFDTVLTALRQHPNPSVARYAGGALKNIGRHEVAQRGPLSLRIAIPRAEGCSCSDGRPAGPGSETGSSSSSSAPGSPDSLPARMADSLPASLPEATGEGAPAASAGARIAAAPPHRLAPPPPRAAPTHRNPPAANAGCPSPALRSGRSPAPYRFVGPAREAPSSPMAAAAARGAESVCTAAAGSLATRGGEGRAEARGSGGGGGACGIPGGASAAPGAEANRASAEECLARAMRLRERGEDTAALRLCERSLRLYPSAAARSLRDHLRDYGSGSAAAAAVAKVLSATSHAEALGVAAGATEAQIRRAYKVASLQLHPDRNGAVGAAQAFARMSEAHTALAARTAHGLTLEPAHPPARAQGAAARAQTDAQTPPSQHRAARARPPATPRAREQQQQRWRRQPAVPTTPRTRGQPRVRPARTGRSAMDAPPAPSTEMLTGRRRLSWQRAWEMLAPRALFSGPRLRPSSA